MTGEGCGGGGGRRFDEQNHSTRAWAEGKAPIHFHAIYEHLYSSIRRQAAQERLPGRVMILGRKQPSWPASGVPRRWAGMAANSIRGSGRGIPLAWSRTAAGRDGAGPSGGLALGDMRGRWFVEFYFHFLPGSKCDLPRQDVTLVPPDDFHFQLIKVFLTEPQVRRSNVRLAAGTFPRLAFHG